MFRPARRTLPSVAINPESEPMQRWMLSMSGACLLWACGGDADKTPKAQPKSAASAASTAPASTAPASKAKAPTSAAPKTAAPKAVTVAPVAIGHTLSPQAQDARQEIALKMLDGRMKALALRDRSNAVIFRDLAARHPHPKVVAMGLKGMGRTFSTRAGQHTAVDDDYRKVVRVRMSAPNPEIRLAAISAARLLAKEPATADALIKLTSHAHAPTRVAAVRMLALLPYMQKGEIDNPKYGEILTALLAASKQTDVATRVSVMERLARTITPKTPQREALAALATTQRADADPAVRGAANLLLATTAADKPATAKALAADLKHAHAYVRGATLEALGLLGHAPAVHVIVPLLTDDAQAKHVVPLEPRAIHLQLDYGRTVQAAALGALRALSKKGFDYKRGDLRKDAAAIIASAQAWYKKAGARIPKL
jgi:Trp operon repressor